MTTKRVFAVDFGASGGKCFSGTFSDGRFAMGEVHRFAHEAVTHLSSDAQGALTEHAYWDQAYLYNNIIIGLQKLARDVDRHVDAIGIDTWGADYQLLNAQGDPLGGFHAYRDHRLDTIVPEVQRTMDPARLYAITGIHFQPFNLSSQLLWLVRNRPALLQPGAFVLPTPSVFTYYLCGSRKVDSTWASITQLMDAKSMRWSDEVLAALGIPASIMPPIVPPGSVLAPLHEPIARAAGVNQAAVLAVGSHDTASAFAAAPIRNAGEALIISSGTWSLVGKLIPSPITTPAAMAFNMSNEGGIGNIRFLRNCMGTWLVQELRRIWRIADGKESDWNQLNAMTAAAPAFTAFIDPDDARFYNPADMAEAIGGFCRETGQPVPADRGTFLRMVYESLALKYRLVNEKASAICASPTKVIHIVGGGSRNEMLNQFTADVTGLPVVAGPEEATAVGNIMVQALALGVIRSLEEALPMIRATFAIRDYTPHNTAQWDKAYARFLPLVRG